MDVQLILVFAGHTDLIIGFVVRWLKYHDPYSNILKNSPPKNERFHIKNSDIFYISAQNIDCGYSLEPPRRGGSNGYPQSMFLSRRKKNYTGMFS